MSGGWSTRNAILQDSIVVSGVTTGTAVSHIYPVTSGGSRNCVVKITTSAATVVGSITAKLQSAIGRTTFVDAKTVTITGTPGDFYIKLNVEVTADQSALPLLNQARVVIVNTNASDTVTITAVDVLQED